MPANLLREQIADFVCRRFVTLKQHVSRHELVVTFENTQVLYEMEQYRLLRVRNNQQEYLPTAGAFALIDGDLHELAAAGTSVVLQALRSLFKVHPPTTEYGFAELHDHALKMKPDCVAGGALQLGLYLAQDFSVFATYKPSTDGTGIDSFRIAEGVITISDPEKTWKDFARRAKSSGNPDADNVASIIHPLTSPDMEEVWPLLHPTIAEIAGPRYIAGCYADAVEAALKSISEQVRARTGIDDDGATLMNVAFSPHAPKLILGDVRTVTGRSLQQGYMQIFAGTMIGVRNPKAHGNVKIDAVRCIHFLFLVSLLAYKLDEAITGGEASEP